MEQKIKNRLYIYTIIIDIFLLSIMYLSNLSTIDRIWILSALGMHLLFYYNLYNNSRKLIDILHCFIFILPILSLFVQNILIKIMSLGLIILIQFLWIIEKRCILNEENNCFYGFGGIINYICILLTAILSFNIGHNYSFLDQKEN